MIKAPIRCATDIPQMRLQTDDGGRTRDLRLARASIDEAELLTADRKMFAGYRIPALNPSNLLHARARNGPAYAVRSERKGVLLALSGLGDWIRRGADARGSAGRSI